MLTYEKYISAAIAYPSRAGKHTDRHFMGLYGIKIDKIIKIAMFLRHAKLFL